MVVGRTLELWLELLMVIPEVAQRWKFTAQFSRNMSFRLQLTISWLILGFGHFYRGNVGILIRTINFRDRVERQSIAKCVQYSSLSCGDNKEQQQLQKRSHMYEFDKLFSTGIWILGPIFIFIMIALSLARQKRDKWSVVVTKANQHRWTCGWKRTLIHTSLVGGSSWSPWNRCIERTFVAEPDEEDFIKISVILLVLAYSRDLRCQYYFIVLSEIREKREKPLDIDYLD